jgi:4-hydroxy-tetrahydrodipicolinate synthase
MGVDFMKIEGLIPATVTPFKTDGSIDFKNLEEHIAAVGSAGGLFGIAVNGHAGEVVCLTSDERAEVVAVAKKALRKGLKMIAGIEGHTADDLVREGNRAKKAGAEMLLVLPPFDVRPHHHLTRIPEAVYPVFERLDKEVGLPMIVFQYPEASGCSYTVPVFSRLAELPNVVAIKAATGSVTKYAELYDALHDRLAVLAACDAPPLLGMLLHGAPGALIGISVVGTQSWSDLVREATVGNAQKAKEIFNSFAIPLMDALFEHQLHRTPISPFAATKEALVQLGQLRSAWVRPPAVNVNKAKREEIRRALSAAGLLELKAVAGG